MWSRKTRLTLFILACAAVPVAWAAVAVVGTHSGSVLLVQRLLSRNASIGRWEFHRAEGTLLSGMRFTGVRASHLPGFPKEAHLRIRQISMNVSLRDLSKPTVIVRNAVLRLPESEPVLASGYLTAGRVRLNVYCRALDVKETLGLFTRDPEVLRFSGWVTDADLTLVGSPASPRLSGRFRVDRLNYRSFSLRDCPGAVALRWKRPKGGLGLAGEVALRGGVLELKNSEVRLGPSRILFSEGSPRPSFDVQGMADIEGVAVRAVLKGTLRRPDLRLSSDPPFPQEHLLLMLATGKRWKGMETVVTGNRLSLDLAADFIDYTALGGTGARLAQQLGLQPTLSVSDDGRTRGVGLRKSLTDRMGVRFGVEQTLPEESFAPSGTTTTRQKVGAELDVTPTDQISVEAEEEVQAASGETVTPGAEPQKSGKVLLKYKKKF